MVKNHLILFYLSMSTLLTDSYAQTGNFDIFNYQSSEFFTQSELPSRVKFEYAKIQAQITWLTSIKDQVVKFKDKSAWCHNKTDSVEVKPFKLQNFDDVACQYNYTMNLRNVIKFTNNCSHMTSEFDFMFISYVRKDDFERAEGDTYISSTYKLSAEVGKDVSEGPLKAEAKIGGGVELEFGRQGLEDVTLIGEAKVGAGTDILDEDKKTASPGIGIAGKDAFPTTVEMGVEGRISMISGKGLLKDPVF